MARQAWNDVQAYQPLTPLFDRARSDLSSLRGDLGNLCTWSTFVHIWLTCIKRDYPSSLIILEFFDFVLYKRHTLDYVLDIIKYNWYIHSTKLNY